MSANRTPGTPLLALGLAVAACVSGCAGAGAPEPQPVEPPGAFSRSGTAALAARWWTAFESPGLDAAVETALEENLDLRTAWERLRAARAVTDRTAALRLPTLEAFADARVSDGSGEGSGGGDAAGQRIDAGLAAGYEIDLWGGIGAAVEADRLRARATLADYRTAALTLSAEVARAWAELAEARAQVALVEEQIETNETVLELLENRFGLGQVRAVDILRQRQLVQATREQRTRADGRRQLLAHRLAVLLGRPPQEGGTFVPEGLPELPPLPETGVPLDLVRRRPDVRGAFLRLQAADRDVAAAVSEQFPRLSLSASASSAAEGVDGLFEEWATSLAGNLLAPLFFGGELRAEVERTRAVRQERLHAFGQATLQAFREVEDALALETRQRERIERIEAQIELAEQAYRQLRFQYLNGTANYLDVLTALDEVQSLRRDVLTARLERVDTRIGLYRALAGPVETARETEAGLRTASGQGTP